MTVDVTAHILLRANSAPSRITALWKYLYITLFDDKDIERKGYLSGSIMAGNINGLFQKRPLIEPGHK